MGGRTPDATDWAAINNYSQTMRATTSHTQAFKSSQLHPDLDPKKFLIRESRHSPANPKSTPVILALDITSSMGDVAHQIAKNGLEKLVTEIFARKPVSDPHIAFGAIGDALCNAEQSLQMSQFESDATMIEQLQKLWVAGGGGGNGSESYTLAWHVAAYHTRTDAYEKDGRKGFLFTFGDDGVPPDLTPKLLQNVYGRGDEPCPSNRELLDEVSKAYHVYHLMIEHGGAGRSPFVEDSWLKMLGERAILVSDYTKLSEIIVSVMQVVAGVDKASVSNSWGQGTDLVVSKAIHNLPGSVATKASAVVRF